MERKENYDWLVNYNINTLCFHKYQIYLLILNIKGQIINYWRFRSR